MWLMQTCDLPNMTQYISTSPQHTQTIAADFAQTVKGGAVIFLNGDLGSGKTTFVQGLAKGLGCEWPVRSPTFTLVNIYPTSHRYLTRIVHVDLYRLNKASELDPLALEEYVNDQTVLLVEWPELLIGGRINPTNNVYMQTDDITKKIVIEP